MNTLDFEARLKNALAVGSAPRSVVDDVMRQIPACVPKPTPRSRWRRPVLAASLAVPTVVAATLIFLVFFAGSAVRLTLADVEAAVQRQAWVHIRYDVGRLKEHWTNLRTGEVYATRVDGSVVYVDRQTNTRLSYWKNSGVIRQSSPTRYAPGEGPRQWTPKTAWEQIVAPLEQGVAESRRENSSDPDFVSAEDSLDGKPVIRFDRYRTDILGRRILYIQLWADPQTHLPMRIRTRLQLAHREAAGKEWSIGAYDFPATGPADLYALGVPRDTPIVKQVTAAPADVQPVLDAINQAHDKFLENYRAIRWSVRGGSAKTLDRLDIIWRDEEKVRQDHHDPAFEVQENNASPLPQPNPAAILAWASKNESSVKQLMNGDREYSWRSAAFARTSKPQARVRRHNSFPLLDQNAWPEKIQWPTRHHSPDFHLLDSNVETPVGCIGFRSGGKGNRRVDYYVDPKNDYVCVKQVIWTKRGAEWAKDREYTLSDLHRVEGRVVAGSQHFHGYGAPDRGVSASKKLFRIDVVPLAAADYPPAIFDPAALTTGANVEGY